MHRISKKSSSNKFKLLGWLLALALAIGASTATAQTITVAAHYTAEEMAPLEPCFAEYEAQNPGVNFNYQQIAYGDYLQTILTARIGGQAPDIYHVYASLWGPQLVTNNVLDTPPDDIINFVQDNYVATTVDAVTIDGQVWGIPTEVSNYLLVYNKRLLQEAGFDTPPATWDELVQMAAAITQRDDRGNIIQAGYAFGPSTANVIHPFLTLLHSQGVSLFKDDFSGTNLTSPEAIEVLEQQIQLFEQGITDRSVEVWDFPSGTIAMMTMAPWYRATLEQAFADAFEETVGVAPIPAGDDWRSLQYAFFFAVDAQSQVKDEAWAFLRWLNEGQAAGELSCTGEMLLALGALTANEGDLETAQERLGDEFTRPYVEALERSMPEPAVLQAAEIQLVLRNHIEQAWAGELTAEEALRRADQEITNILGEFY